MHPLRRYSTWLAALGVLLPAGTVCWPVTARSQPATKESLRSASVSVEPAARALLPARVDLRPVFEKKGLTPRQQGARAICSVFAVTGALEFAAASNQQTGERFSVEFLNWGANRIAGEDVDGGFFSDLWAAFAKYGICREATFPYCGKFDAHLEPSNEALGEARARLKLNLQHHWIKEWNVHTGLSDAQFQNIKHTLAQGWPVCAGLRWPNQPVWTNQVLQMCTPDAVFDGHSVLLVGYIDEPTQPGYGVLIFRNSGDDGRDGCMPYEYARAYMNDAIWIQSDSASSLRNPD